MKTFKVNLWRILGLAFAGIGLVLSSFGDWQSADEIAKETAEEALEAPSDDEEESE